MQKLPFFEEKSKVEGPFNLLILLKKLTFPHGREVKVGLDSNPGDIGVREHILKVKLHQFSNLSRLFRSASRLDLSQLFVLTL
jgi:hypothetical protein